MFCGYLWRIVNTQWLDNIANINKGIQLEKHPASTIFSKVHFLHVTMLVC